MKALKNCTVFNTAQLLWLAHAEIKNGSSQRGVGREILFTSSEEVGQWLFQVR